MPYFPIALTQEDLPMAAKSQPKEKSPAGATETAYNEAEQNPSEEQEKRQKAMDDLVHYVWHNRPAYFPIYGQTDRSSTGARIAEKTVEALIVIGAISGLVSGGLQLKNEVAARRNAKAAGRMVDDVPFK